MVGLQGGRGHSEEGGRGDSGCFVRWRVAALPSECWLQSSWKMYAQQGAVKERVNAVLLLSPSALAGVKDRVKLKRVSSDQ